MAETTSLIRLFLDNNTQNLAPDHTQHPDRFYEGRVIQSPVIERSIPVGGGLVETGEAVFKMADTDRAVRTWVGTKTPRRRMGEVKFGEVGTSESAFKIPYIGEVISARFGPGDSDWTLKDIHYRWLDRPFPTLGTRDTFPNMREGLDEWFIPLGFGTVDGRQQSPSNAAGVLRVELLDTTTNGYVIARHRCDRVELWKQEPGDPFLSIVTFSDYTLDFIPQIIDGVSYDIQWAFFNSPLPDGTIVTANIDGMETRGAFGNSIASLPPQGSFSRNAVDHLINIVFYVQQLNKQVTTYNYQSWVDVWTLFDSLGWLADYAITKIGTTARVAISEITGSFGIDFFADKFGEITLALTYGRTTLSSTDPTFDDDLHLIEDTVILNLPERTINRFYSRFAFNYHTGEAGRELTYDNLIDQQALQIAGESTGHIEDAIVRLPAVREVFVAQAVLEELAAWNAQDAYEAEFHMPAFENIDECELAMIFGLTHWAGITDDSAGWVAEVFKCFGIRLVVDENDIRIRARRRGSSVACPEPIALSGTKTYLITVT